MKIKIKKSRQVKRKCMTLIELLVVLSIVAAVTSLALTSANEMMAQTESDETTRRAERTLAAVEGDGLSASRFISDMGRLPRVVEKLEDTDDRKAAEGKILSELWNPPSEYLDNVKWGEEFFDFENNSWPETDEAEWSALPKGNDVKLFCGWRGPYLNIQKEKFFDGCGHEWQADITGSGGWEDISTVSKGDTIYGIRSLGRNNVADEGDVEWSSKDREFNFDENLFKSSLTVNLKYLKALEGGEFASLFLAGDYMDRVRVAVFAPCVTTSSKSVKRILAVYGGSGSGDSGTAWSGESSVTFTDLTPGPKKLYAYGYLNETPLSNKKASGIISLVLKPGSNSVTVYLTNSL